MGPFWLFLCSDIDGSWPFSFGSSDTLFAFCFGYSSKPGPMFWLCSKFIDPMQL